MSELVSVIIPAYNAEKWIGDTIRSALNQDWPSIELIIVDDGSVDETLSAAKTFESENVKVITQPNSGASAARNAGLAIARGSYIQWLDADDLLAPDKISHQMHVACELKDNRTLLSSSFGTFYSEPGRASFNPTELWQDLAPVEFLLNIFTCNIWMNPAVWLVSRELTDLAGPWNESLSLDDDGEYFSRVVAASQDVKFVPASRSYYRLQNTASLSRRVSDSACESLCLSLKLRINQLRALENSSRTRVASLNLLQTWVEYFYPEKEQLLQQVHTLSKELGGELTPPNPGWKYAPIKAIFGWKTVKKLKTIVANTKLLARVQRDRLRSGPSHK